MTTPVTMNPGLDDSPRAVALYEEARQRNARYTDRLFAALMVLQWLGGMAAALVVSPRTWIGASSQVHISVLAALFGGAVLGALPVALVFLRPGAAITRHVIAVAQMLWSALLIHLTGGRIETHFHVFGSLAFLSFYREWSVLVTATVVIAVDHCLRGLYWPQSVFGVIAASKWRWLEHAAWVLFEDVFLVLSCRRGLAEMRTIAARQAALEEAKADVERTVELRTEQLVEARRAAEAASRAKSDFLANMSHELRTPMTAIIGYADLLLDPQQSPSDRVDALQTIRRNGDHLLTIINDILDISKIEAGRMTVESIDTDPIRIVEEVYSLMQVRALGKGIGLKTEYVFPLPVRVRSDPTRLRQILVNLVGNAIKFTEEGSVTIRVSLLGDQAPRLRFEVIDTGVGMTPEQIERLFRPFAQADSSTTRRFGGAGLGLAISRRLAVALGGDVTISSRTGRGARATATVSAGPLDGVPMLDRPPARLADTGTAPAATIAPTNLHGRVLLAEDGPDNQRLLCFILRRAGFDVDVVENGRVAVERVVAAARAGRPFQLVLMDMQMPELDGYGATSLLRAKGYDVPVVALTAHAMAGDRERCIAAGCNDYVSKPIDRVALLRVCAERLDVARAAG